MANPAGFQRKTGSSENYIRKTFEALQEGIHEIIVIPGGQAASIDPRRRKELRRAATLFWDMSYYRCYYKDGSCRYQYNPLHYGSTKNFLAGVCRKPASETISSMK